MSVFWLPSWISWWYQYRALVVITPFCFPPWKHRCSLYIRHLECPAVIDVAYYWWLHHCVPYVQKHRCSRWNRVDISIIGNFKGISGFLAAILNFLLTPMSRISGYCTSVFRAAPLVRCVEHWTSTPEVWVQTRFAVTQRLLGQTQCPLAQRGF